MCTTNGKTLFHTDVKEMTDLQTVSLPWMDSVILKTTSPEHTKRSDFKYTRRLDILGLCVWFFLGGDQISV